MTIEKVVARMKSKWMPFGYLFVFLAASNVAADSNFKSVFLSDVRLADIVSAVREKRQPQYEAFQQLEKVVAVEISRQPSPPQSWYVPGYYDDAEGHRTAKNGLQDDANAAYALALYFRLTGKAEAAQSAIRIINGWAKVEAFSKKDDSMLSFSYHFPALIFAADLLRDEAIWQQTDQTAFEDFLREKALFMNTMDRKNNWGNWGLVHASACAVYLKDQKLFDTCVERWKYFVEHQIDENGHLPDEVTRSKGQRGIWYSHFCLMPQTIAAEILKVNGVDLYDYVAPNGRTLRMTFAPVAHWTRNLVSFPYWAGAPEEQLGSQYFSYFEILNARWPNEDAAALLKANRPQTARHSAPFLTLTHGRPMD